MAIQFFIKNKKTNWFLGQDNKFSSWNQMRPDVQKFTSEADATVKLTELKIDLENVNILKLDIPERKVKKKDEVVK